MYKEASTPVSVVLLPELRAGKSTVAPSTKPGQIGGKRVRLGIVSRAENGERVVRTTTADTTHRPVIASGAARFAIIYGLVDPREPSRVRYVGQTTKAPQLRLSGHLNGRREQSPKAAWIDSLRAEGVLPDMVLLQEAAPDEDLCRLEGWWIGALRNRGEADLNATAPAGFPVHIASSLADAFAGLCERCDYEYHLPGDTLCSACRFEVDRAYADLPGAES